MAQPITERDSTRNSDLRAFTHDITQGAAQFLHRQFPTLHPDALTFGGEALVAAGGLTASLRNGESPQRDKLLTVSSAALITIGTLCDAGDGALARYLNKLNPGSIDTDAGQLKDVMSDRMQELFLGVFRAMAAHKREDKLGEYAAFANAITSSWTSNARAFSETRGHAVAEAGGDPLAFLGTRGGRAVLNTISTLIPQAKGISIQNIADSAGTFANLRTTAQRLNRAFDQSEPTLSLTKQQEAHKRLQTLEILAGISLGVAVTTFLYLHRHASEKLVSQPIPEGMTEKEYYLGILRKVQKYSDENKLDARFVGGTFTDRIGPETKAHIDVQNRTITLENPNEPTLLRADDSIKDTDLVLFTTDYAAFKRAEDEFDAWREEAQRQGHVYPKISVEAAFQPDWPVRNPLRQWVSAFEYRPHANSNGEPKTQLFLTFGETEQTIPNVSIEEWKMILDDGTAISVLNPIAHAACYALRVPSGFKAKDAETHRTETGRRYSKISLLMDLAAQTLDEGRKNNIDYEALFSDWIGYIYKLQHQPDLITAVKGRATRFFWNTPLIETPIGTTITHGHGPLGKMANLSNTVNGR